ncbi:mechanosensitive ion channel family protein [Calditerrivibrio nitroreducens]|uniref:MscS Mechanosensitive ion channel n=1 Tax=Calditerrivibrio nitroreducens (strain DSM 19672 / NBRC 101217 / Yu37-1) TaxID=768670 RepID=E4TK87_CALNY|nr:mechanosensitive ion channel family protein [Calditerrivibrio nitroreducens]ADR19363.1 MscS Mechanosensitive ion channel [Calditerrivibrio nitroreducens DSM 19672]
METLKLFYTPLIVFGISFVILFITRKSLIKIFLKFAEKTKTTLDDIVLNAIRKPSILWIFALSVDIAIKFSQLPPQYSNTLSKIIHIIIIISITFVAGNLLGLLFNTSLREKSVPLPNTGLLQAIIKITIYIVGILIALNYLGISITPIITALGVGGLAVALALKDTLANLFSGIHILMERAIKVGDFIRMDNGVEGFVEDITWRTTRIKTVQNNFIIVPNEKLVQSIVTNFDLNDKKVSVPIKISVSYDSDIDRVEQILLDEAKSMIGKVEGLLADPEPLVRFNPGFGDSSLDFTLVCYASEFKYNFLIQSEVRKAIFKRFKEEGIEIPFPQRVIHMRQD